MANHQQKKSYTTICLSGEDLNSVLKVQKYTMN